MPFKKGKDHDSRADMGVDTNLEHFGVGDLRVLYRAFDSGAGSDSSSEKEETTQEAGEVLGSFVKCVTSYRERNVIRWE